MSDNYDAAVGSFEGMPKASIGNYKGVMLCNRPNEFGQQRRQEPTGPRPFNSRVDPKTQNPNGWNPCQRVFPKSGKKKNVFNGILKRHRTFLRNLEGQKRMERDDIEMQTLYEEQKVNRFKEQAEKQRSKIKNMKETGAFLDEDDEMNFEEIEAALAEAPAPKRAAPEKLSADALSQMDAKPKSLASKGSKKSKASARPAWALTEKQQDDQKEDEIDGLIEFAYDLDYEQYMEDFEVRQAFEIIKDRIGEIKADQDWKEKIADEWNQTTALENAGADGAPKQVEQQDNRSVYSYRSGTLSRKSGKSQASYKSRVGEAKKAQAAAKQDWERSTVASERNQQTVEDRVAAKIANEVLRDNQKLRGVHSKESIKKILEREAKRQLLAETNGGVYNPPVMSKIQERGSVDKADPSNLPYLHKCPAV